MELYGHTMINLFYRKHDSQKRPRQILQHRLGSPSTEDILIFEEKDERFTCSIDTTSCEKYYTIETSEHTTVKHTIFIKMKKV